MTKLRAAAFCAVPAAMLALGRFMPLATLWKLGFGLMLSCVFWDIGTQGKPDEGAQPDLRERVEL